MAPKIPGPVASSSKNTSQAKASLLPPVRRGLPRTQREKQWRDRQTGSDRRGGDPHPPDVLKARRLGQAPEAAHLYSLACAPGGVAEERMGPGWNPGEHRVNCLPSLLAAFLF